MFDMMIALSNAYTNHGGSTTRVRNVRSIDETRIGVGSLHGWLCSKYTGWRRESPVACSWCLQKLAL
jgi:hypothetical protein